MVLKQGLITDESLCDEHGQRVVGFGFVWSLLKAQGLGSWMSIFVKKTWKTLIEMYVEAFGASLGSIWLC